MKWKYINDREKIVCTGIIVATIVMLVGLYKIIERDTPHAKEFLKRSALTSIGVPESVLIDEEPLTNEPSFLSIPTPTNDFELYISTDTLFSIDDIDYWKVYDICLHEKNFGTNTIKITCITETHTNNYYLSIKEDKIIMSTEGEE